MSPVSVTCSCHLPHLETPFCCSGRQPLLPTDTLPPKFSLVCTAQVAAKQMVGVYLSIWVRQGLLPHVHGTQVTSVGTGVLGYLGNKGGHRSMLCRSACWRGTVPPLLCNVWDTPVPHHVQAPCGSIVIRYHVTPLSCYHVPSLSCHQLCRLSRRLTVCFCPRGLPSVAASLTVCRTGAVTIRMRVFDSGVCFIASHLSSGENEGDELKRNYDYSEIIRRGAFHGDGGALDPDSLAAAASAASLQEGVSKVRLIQNWEGF